MSDGLWRVMPETWVSIDIDHLDSTGEIRMTKSKAPEPIVEDVVTTPAVEPVEPPVPHDAARSNLPAPPPAPPRDYTLAKRAFEAASKQLLDLFGQRPTAIPFATDATAPGEWGRQNHNVHDFWFAVAEAVKG